MTHQSTVKSSQGYPGIISPIETELFLGKLHQSIHKYAPRSLRETPGFDNIINFIEVNDERINLWNANLRRYIYKKV